MTIINSYENSYGVDDSNNYGNSTVTVNVAVTLTTLTRKIVAHLKY